MALCNDYANTPLYDLWLTGIRGIGSVTQHELLNTFKGSEAIYYASEVELEKNHTTVFRKVPWNLAKRCLKVPVTVYTDNFISPSRGGGKIA